MKKLLPPTILTFFFLLFFLKGRSQTITIDLKINTEREAVVFHDEPVLFHISVSNKKAESDERWNMAGAQRLQEMDELLKQGKIKQEDYDREKASIERNKRSSETIELGSASSSWTNSVSWKIMNTSNREYVTLPIKLMKNPSTEGKAILDVNGYYTACFGIDPGGLGSSANGTYAVEFFIANIPSNAVLLKIENGMMSPAIAGTEAVLLRFGQYFWHDERGDKVVDYAERILAKNPASLDGLSLKGDGQVLQKLYQPALDTYKKAVAEYFKQNGLGSEPPEYLNSMIAWLKEQQGM